MRLVFVGDIGIDRPVDPEQAGLPDFQSADLLVANLEGAILSGGARAGLGRRRRVAVHNDPAVMSVLQALGVGAVGLANNHAFDYDAPIGSTRRALEVAGIGSFGAGRDRAEASAPHVVSREGTVIKLFGFGWEMIGCRAATARQAGVNPLRPARVLETARRERRSDPDAFIVFQMHWNYELERYPHPAHRQLAHDLVAAGVDAVIGGHPHVVGGVEVVDGKPICYSLGNWLFPHRDVDGFRVEYPPISRRQLAVELSVTGRDVRQVALHWYDFDPETLRFQREAVERAGSDGAGAHDRACGSDGIVGELTPFAGLSHAEYVDWFRTHRTRRRGLPIYADYRASTNGIRNAYLRLRQSAGEVAARLGLKREQRSPSPRPASEGGG